MEQKSSTHCSIKGSAKIVVFLILIVVILAAVGGFFYWQNWQNKNSMNLTKSSEPLYAKILHKFWPSRQSEALNRPKLFEKGDYKVEERADGKYIVVDKVGLTAKVPTGWRVEFEGNDMPDGTSQYWVNLLSEDAEKKSGLLVKGCGVSVLVGTNKDAQDIQNAVENINDGMDKMKETKPDFIFNVVTVSMKKALESTSPIRKIFGKVISVSIPIQENLVVLDTRIPEGYENTCSVIWESFLKTIDLK